MYPPRTSSWWLATSASAGASRRVRTRSRDMRMGADPTVRPRGARTPAGGPLADRADRSAVRRWLLAEPLPDQGHLGLGCVRIGALGVEQLAPVGLGLGLGAGVGRSQPGLHPLGHQPLGLRYQGIDHFVLRHDPDDLPLDEEMAALPAGRDPDVRL